MQAPSLPLTAPRRSTLVRIVRDNSLALVMFGLFALFLAAQAVAGVRAENADRRAHDEPAVGLAHYLTGGHFLEALFENWESEFLQMGAYVLFTAWLLQRGASESKDPDAPHPSDADPRTGQGTPGAPWPVRRGGVALVLYEHSLGLALGLLFLASIGLHLVHGARVYSAEQVAHGGAPISPLGFLRTAQFWFESFQNWQSEFLAVGVLLVLSVVLRQRGSPESKPVASRHRQTGDG